MQDVFSSRRGLVVSAAVVILCIVGFFLVTAPNWRSLVNKAPNAVATIPPTSSGADTQSAAGAVKPGTSATTAFVAPAPGNAPVKGSAPAQSGSASTSSDVSSNQTAQAPGQKTAPGDAAAPKVASTSGDNPAPAPPVAPAPSPSIGSAQNAPATSASPATSPTSAAQPAGPAKQDNGGSQTATQTSPAVPDLQAKLAPPVNSPPVPAANGASSAQVGTGAQGEGKAPQSDALTKPAEQKPTFDIVRVEPGGDSVIAARGAPNAEFVLLDGTKPIAHAKADASGQVALLPPALEPGEHSLMLSMTSPGRAPAVSSQSVAVSVNRSSTTPPMVALLQPNQPATILSGPVAGSGTSQPPKTASLTPSNDAMPPATPEPPAIRSVEVESMGSFFAAGRSAPGSKSRVYLNGAYVATVTADPKGNWSLRINRGMKPGHYDVRADQVEPDGKVVSRVQVPFEYPVQVATAQSGTEGTKKNTENSQTGSSEPGKAGNAGSSEQAAASSQAGSQPGGSTAAGAHAGDVAGASGSPRGPTPLPAGSATVAAGSGSATSTAVAGHGGAAQTAAEQASTSSASGLSQTAAPPSTVVATAQQEPTSAQHGAVAPGSDGPTTSQGKSTQGDAQGTAVLQKLPAAPTVALPNSSAPVDEAKKRSEQASAEPAKPVTSAKQNTPQSDVAADSKPLSRPMPTIAVAPKRASTPYDVAESVDGLSPTVIEELVTAKVTHGDSLWRISRQMLGHGIRYTQIYAANTQQIRDPRLIFPGQVFVLPQE